MKITSSVKMECNLMARLSSECATTLWTLQSDFSHLWVQIFHQLTIRLREQLTIWKLSSLFMYHFSLFFFIQLCGNCAVELQNTAEERESLYGQALPPTLPYFYKVEEINIILAVDLVGRDIWIVLMTIIHFSPTRQLWGNKKNPSYGKLL